MNEKPQDQQQTPTDSQIQRPISKKKTRFTVNNSVRQFWFTWLKPALEAHPMISKSNTFIKLVKLKDVSMKKLKNLVYEAMENKEDFELTKTIYKELLKIIKSNPTVKRTYPKYSTKLKIWFEKFATMKYEDFVQKQHPQKIMKEEVIDSSSTTNENLSISSHETIRIPIEYLVNLQNQISLMIQWGVHNSSFYCSKQKEESSRSPSINGTKIEYY
jgi:hypothetical protein